MKSINRSLRLMKKGLFSFWEYANIIWLVSKSLFVNISLEHKYLKTIKFQVQCSKQALCLFSFSCSLLAGATRSWGANKLQLNAVQIAALKVGSQVPQLTPTQSKTWCWTLSNTIFPLIDGLLDFRTIPSNTLNFFMEDSKTWDKG